MKNLVPIFFVFFGVNLFAQQKTDSIKKWETKGKLTFLFNQATFSNWTAGGDNSIAGNIDVDFEFNYKKERWNWNNKIFANYGLSYIDKKGLRKTSDRFEYNSILGLKTSKYWFVSFFSNFKTQFSTGYNYKKTPKEKISNILAPAYWSFGPGFLWKKSSNFYINIAPATARYTFVTDEFSGSFGVQKGRNTTFGLGFNLSSYYKFKIMENVQMENILSLYSDYLEKPENIDVDYQIIFSVKANKYLTMNLGFHTIMDANASGKIQFKEVFGLGINYTFHKK